MWLTDVSIRRPVFIIMVVAGLIVLGYVGTTRMPVDLYPDVDFPIITIVTLYPGAGPEEIEELVTEPIEEATSIVPDLRTVLSTSQENVSTVMLEFHYGTELDVASSDVRDRLDAVRMELPEDAESPTLFKADIAALPVLNLGIFGDRPARELRELAEDVIKERLAKLPGVAAIGIAGGREREIQIEVDKARLDAMGMSILELTEFIGAENLDVPSGEIKEGRKTYSVRMLGRFQSVAEIEQIQVATPAGTMRLADLATVRDTVADVETITRVDRRPSVNVSVQKQADANTIQVADGAYKAIEELREVLPDDVELVLAQDNSEYIREALRDVREALLLGAVLASLVVLLFLQDIRGTIIVALAIPTSIMATFLPISFMFGFTINMMVMLAFSLSVGILVDDSIVVIENISRHLHLGEQPAAAALNGRTEIGFAAITITLVDVVVFVPVAFMRGIVGQFFFSFGITAAIVTLFSLFVSFTLTPMMASRFFRRVDVAQVPIPRRLGEAVAWAWQPLRDQLSIGHGFEFVRRWVNLLGRFIIFGPWNWLYDNLEAQYKRALRWPVYSRFAVRLALIVAAFGFLVAFVAFAFLTGWVGQEFMPEMDQGRVNVLIETPVGTRLEATDEIARRIEEVASDKRRYPEVESLSTIVGSLASSIVGFGGERGADYAEVDLVLVPKVERERTDQDIIKALIDDLAPIRSADIKVIAGGREGGGTEAPIQVEVSGAEMDELLRVANQLKTRLEHIDGLVDVDLSWRPGRPEVRARIDRQKAAELGLPTALIAGALRTSLAGEVAGQYREAGKEYDIRVRLREIDRNNVAQVGSVIVGSRMGLPVYLEDVATLTRAAGPTKLERKNRQPMIAVSANLSGIVLGEATQKVTQAIEQVDPGTTTMESGGRSARQQENFAYIFESLAIAVILVYMVMAGLFNTFRDPLVIMFTLPMALVGALMGLGLTGYTISIVSLIGVIMLMGLVGKNAILMVDYTNTLRARGETRREAVCEAGPTRMRPILMTTIATIFGVLPTALALNQGSEWRAPMAVVVIGGLILSTLLTLLMIPIMYMTAEDITDFVRRLYHWVFRGWRWEDTRQLMADWQEPTP
ncbi:MAG: efflux RND transporter permease subunit [Armatimonadota bacterium]